MANTPQQVDYQKKVQEAKERIAKMSASKGVHVEPIQMPPPPPKNEVQPVPSNVKQAAKVAKPTPFHPSLKPEFFTFYSRVAGSTFVFSDGTKAIFAEMFVPQLNYAAGVYRTPNPAKAKELEGALGSVIFKL